MAATFSNSSTPAGTFAGRAPTPPSTHQARINHDPVPAWWYMAHPSRWFCKDGEWLPILKQLSSKPGQSNVQSNGDTSLAETLARKDGWTVIPWDVIESGYIRVFDGVRGPVHLSKWETPRQVGTQLVMLSDEEGYRDFLRGLLANGHIAPPDPVVLDMLMERQSARVKNNENRLHEPIIKARHDADAALLADMQTATAKATEAGAVKRGRRG